MVEAASPAETMVERQVFPRWAITLPADFDDTFLLDDAYWHAWDERRSISLTSLRFTDRHGRRVSAKRILKRIGKLIPDDAQAQVAMPAGLDGWAVVIKAEQPARASRAISGIIAVDGGVLLVTITADDIAWATLVWLSIRRSRTPGDA